MSGALGTYILVFRWLHRRVPRELIVDVPLITGP